ncbi:MAG: DUF3822 family protein [Flavisolibacter sp.]|nr:DUF3822 family protein [Flavisolibacter sp.]
MKTIFDIGGHSSTNKQILLLEIGADHIYYALFDPVENRISRMVHLECDESELQDKVTALMKEYGSSEIFSCYVSSAFPQALLLPFSAGKNHKEILHAVYDEPASALLKDDINEWQIQNVYLLPAGILESITSVFPGATFCHAYTSTLKTYNGVNAEDQIAIHFTTKKFQVLVKKNGTLQLAQVYQYVSPLDVIYYLLKICSELGLEQSKVYLIVSGLIEKDSALYKQLRDYFLHIVFFEPVAVKLPEHDLPVHFFTSLNNLAACAS